MNEPPGARARVGLTGLTVAEYFRDIEGQDVLLFIDNIFRFTQVRSFFWGGLWTYKWSNAISFVVFFGCYKCGGGTLTSSLVGCCPGELRSVCLAGTYSVCCGVPAYSGDGSGRSAGAHHDHEEGLHHFRAGYLRAC